MLHLVVVVLTTVVFDVILGPFSVESQVLGHQSGTQGSVSWYEPSIKSDIDQILPLVPLLTQHLEGRTPCISKGLWLAQGSTLLLVAGGEPSLPKMLYIGVKAICRYQLDFSIFSRLCRWCLQQRCLVVSLWRATYSLGNSLCFLR